MQLGLYNALDSSSFSATILFPANIPADGNKNPSKCETGDSSEELCYAILKPAKVFPANNAEAFYEILIR